MSHELRTPLNAIIGVTETLREDARDLKREDESCSPRARAVEHLAPQRLMKLNFESRSAVAISGAVRVPFRAPFRRTGGKPQPYIASSAPDQICGARLVVGTAPSKSINR
jgi:hypothetical protein